MILGCGVLDVGLGQPRGVGNHQQSEGQRLRRSVKE